jgi:type IV fimbrial biogenesis protein FimT
MSNGSVTTSRVRLAARLSPAASRASGVTLVELMFALTVLGILLAIAVPSFRGASLSSRLSAIANDLHSSVQIARSEAIKSNTTVTLCTSTNGTSCAASGDWEQGWIVLDVNDNVIDSHAALQDGYRVIEASGTEELLFQPIGVGASAAAFKVCREDPLGEQERAVTITGTGLAYVTRTELGTCP